MKVKLDENLGAMGALFLKAAGFDVATVADQNLLSTPDADLARICTTEGGCLVTLDRDFSDPLRYAAQPVRRHHRRSAARPVQASSLGTRIGSRRRGE